MEDETGATAGQADVADGEIDIGLSSKYSSGWSSRTS
jgi:hypothetical protein